MKNTVLFLSLLLVLALLLTYLGEMTKQRKVKTDYQQGFDDAINVMKFNKKRVFDDNIVILKDSIYLDSNLVISKNITFVR